MVIEKMKEKGYEFFSFVYSSFKKLVRSTTLFTNFAISGDILQYHEGTFVWGYVGHYYTRPGIVKGYIDSATANLPNLSLYSEDLFKGRTKLVSFGATAIVLETLQVIENVYTYYGSVSADKMASESENVNTIDGRRYQVYSVEAYFKKKDTFYDFVVNVEERQTKENRTLTKQEIAEMFYDYRFWGFIKDTGKQFWNVGVGLVFLIATLLKVPLALTIGITVMAAVCIWISGVYYSRENERQYAAVLNRLDPQGENQEDPEALLRRIEAILRKQRGSYWISKQTKRELKADEKMLRNIRKHLNSPEEGIANIVKQANGNNSLVRAIAENLQRKYSTTELVKKEFKSLARSIFERLCVPAVTYVLVFSAVMTVFPMLSVSASIYAAIYLSVAMVVISSKVIEPLENMVESFICRNLYKALRYQCLVPIIRFFVTEQTLQEYDCYGKTQLQRECLDLVSLTDSPAILANRQDNLQDEVLKGTRFEYQIR